MNRPTNDWTCQEVLDAKAIDPAGQARCGFCGTSIRWVHVLHHDDHDGTVEAGCCCAARLCFEYDAEGAEREVKNRLARLTRFIDLRRWKVSRSNAVNVWRSVKIGDERIRITVFLKDGAYMVYLSSKAEQLCHPSRYGSQVEALTMAFELVEGMRQGNGDR